ncbi:MAG: PhzF family phenazine biosynthesis protein [Candidatus Krumholzibacteria bacterium]|nr:PhzF family phenazine biosynthesis protein [Candidatus Krumholzibacteria bacterium]
MLDMVIKQVDAFTADPFCGNPAGVITDADALSSEDMLRISGEMNLAETGFITMPTSPDAMFRIRFFTPTEEVDISGHVTIASCYALIEDGRIPLSYGVNLVHFETGIGTIRVEIHYSENDDGGENVKISGNGDNNGYLKKIMMQQSISSYYESPISTSEIASILGIDPGEISGTGLPMEVVATGLEQLIVPVKRRETILDLNPDLIKLGLVNKKYNIHTNHIFSLDTFSEECISYARHFAPAVGMWEDPATGTAAAGLGTYLLRHGVATNGTMVMEQGKESGNLARILVEMKDSDFGENLVQIGGLAVTSITRKISVQHDTISVS